MSKYEDDEKVGYGRPPRKHRFKPGQSGNPKGRPKKEALKLVMREMLSMPVTINGKKRPYHKAFLQVMMKRALEGNRQANQFIAAALKESGLLNMEREVQISLSLEGAREELMRKFCIAIEETESSEAERSLPEAEKKD